MPMFSVIVPTRNRAPLLRNALTSVLQQSFGDFELVVSDNFSADDTAQVARSFEDARIRYVRTEAPLSMPDSWEFALGQARGDYVAYLSDDDAWCPRTLEKVAKVISSGGPEVVNVALVWYYYPDWVEPRMRNSVSVPPCTGRVTDYESARGLGGLYGLGDTGISPRMLDTFCSSRTIKRIKGKMPRIFLNPCPDYSFSAVLMANSPGWTRIDQHLCVIGQTNRSIGAATMYTRGNAHHDFMGEFGSQKVLGHTPLRTEAVTNLICNTLLEVRSQLPEALSGYDIDWRRYFYKCWEDLMRLKANGVDIGPELEEWRTVLAGRFPSIKARVESDVHMLELGAFPEGSRLRRTLWTLLRTATTRSRAAGALWEPVDRMLEKRIASLVRGSEAGFGDILGCARYIDGLGG